MTFAEQKLGKSNILGDKLFMLLEEFSSIKPHTYIEIGVFNCETFFKVVDTMNDPEDMFFGFDYFEDLKGKELHKEIAPHDPRYITFEDAINIAEEKQKRILFIKGDTKDTLYKTIHAYLNEIKTPVVIFLDGGHSYETCYTDMYYTWYLFHEHKDIYMFVDDLQFPNIRNASNDFIKMLREENFKECVVKNYNNGLLQFRW